MMRGKSRSLTLLLWVACWATAPPQTATAQLADSAAANSAALNSAALTENELTEDEQRQVQIAERFLTVLERNPRRGTALDRIYGHHVEFGTLDQFLTQLRERVAASPDDGDGWMLLGLFEAHRGEDAAAIEAFQQAEELRTGDALAPYYLGQSLLLMGQPEGAVEAYERAIARNPRRADMLEIFRQLGRLHQRAQRTEEALRVWERLEALFPDDPRVQEQIAITLVEEGEYGLALPRYEKLATLVRDDYRRVVFRIEAAELKIREGRRVSGLEEFEELLGNLNPDGWLHRDVRRRVEDVFLRTGDQDGLVEYYENWIESHPEDVDAMARLARFLASSARVPEATQWMEKALRLAPSRGELRKAFIDQLIDDQRFSEAGEQYSLLVESAPGNPDYLRDWGKLVLRDKQQPLAERQAATEQIWRRILATRPDDAVTTAQVADYFRQANMSEAAVQLYQQAIELAPQDPQYREYLGEYYHILKRPEDALGTWASIIDGSRRTASNVVRLAEVYNSFGYLDQAIEQIAAACQLDSREFNLQLKAAEYHNRGGKFAAALDFVEAAEQLAASEDERAAVLSQQIEVFQASRQLDEEIELLAARVAAGGAVADWHRLARYNEADRRWAAATEAIEAALKIDPKSVLSLTAAARIAELSGNFGRSAEMSRQLASVDRRSRGDHLMNVARLEAQLGRSDEALAAGRELIVAAPGNTENYEFYAQLCFRLGKTQEGLDALRKAVRINPTEPVLIMALGSALAADFRTDEAIEVYWRAFEKSQELADKTSLTMKLAELYLQLNQFEKLIERFERDRRQDDKRREMTICLAQAHHSSGDYGTARMELESLLSENTRDTNLLQQISKLCEDGSDLDAAVEYQRQLVAIAPSHETEFRLAGLLQQRGDRDEASEIFVRLTQREEDPARLLRSLDSLISQGSNESAIAVTEPLLREQRDDWELLYREGVAWASLDNPVEAEARFRRLLDLYLPHDALGIKAQEQFKQAQARAKSNNLRGLRTSMPQRQSPLSMLNQSSQVRRAAGLDSNNYYSSSPQRIWTPDTFGVARMAAYGWLLRFEQDRDAKVETPAEAGQEEPPSFVEGVATAAAADDAERYTIYDWLYIEQLRGNYDSIFQVSRRLAQQGQREEQQFYLNSLRLRGMNAESQQVNRSSQQPPQRDPLGESDLELMISCFEALRSLESSPEAAAAMYGGQVTYASNGQMYVNIGGRWVMFGSGFATTQLGIVVEELKLAGREELAEEMLSAQVAAAKTPQELAAAMAVLFDQEKFDQLKSCYGRWIEAARDHVATAPAGRPNQARNRAGQLGQNANFLLRWMGQLGAEEENAEVLAILDEALNLAIEEAKKRQAERSSRARSRQASLRQGSTNFNIIYGKQSSYVRLSFPPPNDYIDNYVLMLLREAYEVLKRNDVLSDLTDHLRGRVAATPPENSLYEQLLLGYSLWWTEEQDEAVEWLARAADQLKGDTAFRLEMASLHEARGDFDEALAIVEAVAPRDQRLVQQKELKALELAERLGDIERARSAAERLFGLRIDNNTQLQLVERMRRLGLHDLAEAVVSRVHRRSGNQTSALASLMELYKGQGKVDLAEQIAHTILRRTSPPSAAMSNSSRNPFRSGRSADPTRAQAVRVLQQTGALKKIVERIEQQLERSPESPRLYEQLIEYYQATNQRDLVQSLLERAVAQRPDAIVFRYQLAQQLEATGKTEQACDHYLVILKEKPSWIADDLYSVRRVFERSQRSLELVRAIEQMNLKALGHPYYVIDLVTNLLAGRGGPATEEDSTELGIRLFERVFAAFPQYRNQMISQLRAPKLWTNERIYELGKRGIIPSANEVAGQPWFGISNIYSYSSNGTVNSMFHQMLNGLKETNRLSDLRETIETSLEQTPKWHGGQAMLALIDLQQNKKEAAKERLEALFADEKVLEFMPGAAGWIVGQELDQFEDTRELAVTVMEHAVQDNQQQNQLRYSPLTKLVKLYADSGRKEQAREIMLKQLKGVSLEHYDANYAQYQQAENKLWVANQMVDLGFAVDAARLFGEMANRQNELEQVSQNYRGRAGYFEQQLTQGMNKALAALDDGDSDEAIAKLLAVPEDVKPGTPILDLMLVVPGAETLREQPMQSRLLELLQAVAKTDAFDAAVSKRFEALRQDHPADLSIALAAAAFRLHVDEESAGPAIEQLVTVASDSPLESIPSGRRANARQRREALPAIPLWLVARECLADKSRQHLGQPLAELALQGARRQLKTDHIVAILFDWGQIALDAGDRELAEAKWSELLDVVTRRPGRSRPADKRTSALDRPGNLLPSSDTRRSALAHSWPRHQAARAQSPAGFSARGAAQHHGSPAASPPFWQLAGALLRPTLLMTSLLADDSPAEHIPPLTISQFRLTVEIAVAAAEQQLPALSQRAVRASLAGGLPVEDLKPNDTQQRSRVVMAYSAANPQPTDNIATEVASSLQRVLREWNTVDYSAEEIYPLLRSIVFPAARSSEILLYADSSKLKDAQIDSLADQLVRWSKEADQLDDLRLQIDARKSNTNALVPALVLQVKIALAGGQLKDAGQQLDALAEAVKTRSLPVMTELACHAALPATEHPVLEEAAYGILRTAVQDQAQVDPQQRVSSSDTASLGGLATLVNQYLARTGQEASVREFFDNYLMARQQHYARYSGSYGQYLQGRDIASLAQDAAKSGLASVALDFLGRVADFDYDQYSPPGVAIPLAIVNRDLRGRSAAARYRAWRDWTIPNETRQTVRLAAEWTQPIEAPAEFLDPGAGSSSEPVGDFVCNLVELLDAAEAAGSLDELRSLAQQAHEEKLPNSEFLWPLVLIRTGDVVTAEPLIRGLIATLLERNKRQNNQARPTVMGDYLVYRACLRSPEFRQIYGAGRDVLQNTLRANQQTALIIRAPVDFAIAEAEELRADLRPGDEPGLLHWFPSTTAVARANHLRPWWVAQEGMISRISGPAADLLYFNYPLAGNFEVTLGCYDGGWAESDAGFGGFFVEANRSGARAAIRSVSGHDYFYLPQGRKRDRESFADVRLRIADGKFQHFHNNHLLYEEEMSSTSPWLALFGYAHGHSTFRNLAITGDPIIPREVALLSGSEMDGWNSSFLNETQPRQRLMKQPSTEDNSISSLQGREPSRFDWWTEGGVLHGQAKPESAAEQSWICYQRPFREGETFRYEFYYEPRRTVAHPTIGRTALILEEEGVAAHWITRIGWEDEVAGIAADNRIVESSCRVGAGPLPLKPHDWNQVQLAFRGGMVAVSLNGSPIYQRPTPESFDTRLGFYRHKDEALKVRNAVLSGDWPQEFTEDLRQNLLATRGSKSPADRYLINRLMTDRYFRHGIPDVLSAASSRPDQEAYTLLRQWVLPSDDHEGIRLYYEFGPPARASGGPASSAALEAAVSTLSCPAAELVRVAGRLGRLSELREQVEQISPADELDLRGQAALLALLAIESRDDKTAGTALGTLYSRLEEESLEKPERPEGTIERDKATRLRSAEFVAAWEAVRRPALLHAARELAIKIRNNERSKRSASADFTHGVGMLVGRTETALARSAAPGETSDHAQLTQWHQVSHQSPLARAKGRRPSSWRYDRGVVKHVSAGAATRLFYQSPLRGDFEIVLHRSTHGYREAAVSYAMHAAEPAHNLKSKRIYDVLQGRRSVTEEIKLPTWEQYADFRIRIEGPTIKTFTNGVLIHEESVGQRPEPWIVLEAADPVNPTVIHDLRILGSPEIPVELDLVSFTGHSAWRADQFGETFAADGSGGDNIHWVRSGEELLGRIRKDRTATPLESLLRYHRPLLEDGVLEYEAFYTAGELEVHPSIGRLAFLIRPAGVAIHELTDAQWEARGRSPGNETPLPNAVPVVLRDKEWNQFRLAVRGDLLTLQVNGTEVAQYTLDEPHAERFFGLFRYADEFGARVRNIVYRGDWPRQLPAVEDQQLAYPAGGPYQSDLPDTVQINLAQSPDDLAKAGLTVLGPVSGFDAADGRLHMKLANAEKYASWPGLALRRSLAGGCLATVDYRDLRITPTKEGWGLGFALQVRLTGLQDRWVELGVFRNRLGKQQLKTLYRHTLPSGKVQQDQMFFAGDFTEGSLRIVQQDGHIYCLYAPHDTSDFRLLHSYVVGDARVTEVAVQHKCSDRHGTIDISLGELQVKHLGAQVAGS